MPTNLEYRYFGRTGVRVSPLCLGCMMFGGQADLDSSCAMIDRFLDRGLNFLDTANVYHDGKSEQVVGEALKRNGHRHHVFLATKVHGNMHKDDPLDPNKWGNSRRGIVEQCDASLRRLQTDWIDLYQLHRPHPDCPIDESLRALDDLIRAGKVRYVGTSTFAAWQVVESLWCSERHHLNRFVSEQPPYHLLDRRIERELIPVAQTYGLAIIPWSPLASGFLTGKYRRGQKPPQGARLQETGWRSNLLASEKGFDVVERLAKIAEEKSCSVSQLALAWNMSQPAITAPIIGPRTMEQLDDNLGALEVKLTDADRKSLDEVSPPGRCIVPYYDASFGPHPQRW